MKVNNCPFKLNDRIINKGHDLATVTEITSRGFKYELDKAKPFIHRWNMSFLGGEIYCDLDWVKLEDYLDWKLL